MNMAVRLHEQRRVEQDVLGALIALQGMMERGELVHAEPPSDCPFDPAPALDGTAPRLFNMASWRTPTPCGTVCCIAGSLEMLLGRRLHVDNNVGAHDLFYMYRCGTPMRDVTVAQAARAIRNFVECGDANWNDATRGDDDAR